MITTLFEPDRGQRVPVHVWARDPPPDALRQLQRLASMPYVFSHVAAMADVHLAEGVAVGTVFATENVVVPDALGGDLGCGMCALRFPLEAATLNRGKLEALLLRLGQVIPVGDAVHHGGRVKVPDALLEPPLSTGALEHTRTRQLPRQLGTLGGGNHFLELERDPEGWLWVVVHTGSRGLGAAVASHHRRAAGGEREALAGLEVETPAGQAYLQDLAWALEFARANREALLERAMEVIVDSSGVEPDLASRIDLHHNFVARETHAGRSLWVHRKGATHAPMDAVGIVPGSMGTATYLVRGLGSDLSFHSCSHGAGRVLTRREARQSIRRQMLEHAMRRVVFDQRRLETLVEETPSAYRDIRKVLEDQADLVTPLRRLEPLAVLKG